MFSIEAGSASIIGGLSEAYEWQGAKTRPFDRPISVAATRPSFPSAIVERKSTISGSTYLLA